MNVAIYTRSGPGAQHDLALHEYDLIALAYDLGATQLHHYQDVAAGSAPHYTRPDLSRLIDDIRLSRISMVVAASVDRLARHGEDFDEFARVLLDADVPLHTLEQGRIHFTERRDGKGGRPEYEMGWFNIPRAGLSDGR